MVLRFLIIPQDDKRLLTLIDLRRRGCKKRYSRQDRCKITNKYFGLHPVTAQHRWLRVLAQTCLEFKNIVYYFRAMLNMEYCRIHKTPIWGKESFLVIEKKMTIQASSHNKRVKKSKRPKKPWIIRVAARKLALAAFKSNPHLDGFAKYTKIAKMEAACMHPFQYYLKHVASTHKARTKRRQKMAYRPEKQTEDTIQENVDHDIDYMEERMPKINGKRYE